MIDARKNVKPAIAFSQFIDTLCCFAVFLTLLPLLAVLFAGYPALFYFKAIAACIDNLYLHDLQQVICFGISSAFVFYTSFLHQHKR